MSDNVSKILGNFGIWQLRAVLIIFLCKIPASWFMACIIYTAPAPRENEWYCKPPNELNNIEPEKWINAAHPKYTNKYNEIQIDHCHIYADAVNRTIINNNSLSITYNDDILIDCEKFEHKADFYSLVMQFDLVCGRDILLAWSQYWHLFGILLGSVLALKMMLYISPRKVMFSGMIAQIICGCLTGFLPDFNLNCFFRVNSAICCAVMFVSGQAIFQDITGGKYRIGITTLYDTFWSIGLFLLPGLSNYFSSWSFIYLAITLPTIILILLYPWIPDAPRWLLKNGRIKETEQILLQAAEINDRMYTIPINLTEQLQYEFDSIKLQQEQQQQQQQQHKPIGWLDLWKGPKAKRHLITTHIAWAIYVINFMGLLLNVRSFPNGREHLGLNTVITGFSEIIGCFLAMHFSINSEHKWMYAGIFNITAGLIGCLGWIFPNTWDDITALSMWMLISSIAKCATSCAQSMLTACTAELVPPEKRQMFMFSCIVWSRTWLLTAPFIGVFKRIHIALSLSAYCILSIIGGICLCSIRPQKTIPLPSEQNQTITTATTITMVNNNQRQNQQHQNNGDSLDGNDNERNHYHQNEQQQGQGIWTIPNNLIEKTKF